MSIYPTSSKKSLAYKDHYEDRHRESRPETMIGATIIRKTCICCKTSRSTGGGKLLDLGFKQRRFVCSICVGEGHAERLTEEYRV